MELAVGLGPAALNAISGTGEDLLEKSDLAGAVFGTLNPNLFHLITSFVASTAFRADLRRSVDPCKMISACAAAAVTPKENSGSLGANAARSW